MTIQFIADGGDSDYPPPSDGVDGCSVLVSHPFKQPRWAQCVDRWEAPVVGLGRPKSHWVGLCQLDSDPRTRRLGFILRHRWLLHLFETDWFRIRAPRVPLAGALCGEARMEKGAQGVQAEHRGRRSSGTRGIPPNTPNTPPQHPPWVMMVMMMMMPLGDAWPACGT